MSAAAPRWTSLDALRGLSIAAMILVNNPGRWGEAFQYAPLRHAEWHGCTFTDLVFPTFLFCAGCAIVPAMNRRLERGVPRGALVAGIGRRVLWLIALGILLAAFPLVSFAGEHWLDPLTGARWPGVLQRIGICYGIAAWLYLFVSIATQRAVLVGCLLVYWPLITLVPVPGFGAPDLGDPAGTLAGYVDRAVFGDHIWVPGAYDPEGLLSTVPALATCLLGVEAGRVLARPAPAAEQAGALLYRGVLLMALGAVWGWALPLNKALWTSSYAVLTAGIATCGLGLGVVSFAGGRLAWLLYPLRVYGTNALLVFVGSGLLGRIIGRLITVEVGGRSVSLLTAACKG